MMMMMMMDVTCSATKSEDREKGKLEKVRPQTWFGC